VALERFEREARAASALNHPNICTIHGAEEHEGQPFIVMELLEGETLRDWLKRAPTLEPSLEIARQVLGALRVAHRAGIVHRDLKPENIMVRIDGYVKVLDFGVAKLMPTSPLLGTKGTLAPASSRPGQILGTLGYMSPEQILGRHTDQRSDLFSFGIILYEMLTGQHPWPGTSPVDRLHAILHSMGFDADRGRRRPKAQLFPRPRPSHWMNSVVAIPFVLPLKPDLHGMFALFRARPA
jgi:serine/threonine protein kinase